MAKEKFDRSKTHVNIGTIPVKALLVTASVCVTKNFI